MPIVIRVDGLDHVQKKLKDLSEIAPAITKGIRNWGRGLARDTKLSAHRANIRSSTGMLYQKIEWRQKEKGHVGMLFIPQYGIDLDSMRPHFVALRNSRTRLMAWARQARYSRIREGAKRVTNGKAKFSIYVRPHPFIERAFMRTRPKLSTYIRRSIDEQMRT